DFNGTDSFTYMANDGQTNSATATVTITVNSVNDTPTVVDSTPSVDEDMALIGNALVGANDVDGDPLTAVQISGPANGTLTLNPDGSYTYTPDPNYNGSDSFTFAATDGTATSTPATVSITVNSVNDTPTVQSQTPMTDEDTPLNVPAPGVLTGANDLDG